ncbi:hypothetical protein Tco_0553114 [Tanacetum coccineum]
MVEGEDVEATLFADNVMLRHPNLGTILEPWSNKENPEEIVDDDYMIDNVDHNDQAFIRKEKTGSSETRTEKMLVKSMSCGKRMVAKYGQRPPRFSVPKKGKQRKQSRFQSYVRCKVGVIVNPDDKTKGVKDSQLMKERRYAVAGCGIYQEYVVFTPQRPRKKRIRSKGEGGSSTRLSKIGSQGKCSKFKKPGHNKASYKELILEQTPKPKGVPGKRRKKQSVVNLEDADVDEVGWIRRYPRVRYGSIGDFLNTDTRIFPLLDTEYWSSE